MIPLEIITGLGSFAIGAAVKLLTLRMEMKHQEQKALMEKAGLEYKSVDTARRYGLKDIQFSITRRTIALTLLATVVAPMWMPFIGDLLDKQIAVAIPAITEENIKVLFGIFSHKESELTYKVITTATYLPEYSHYFAAVMGLYFGAKR